VNKRACERHANAIDNYLSQSVVPSLCGLRDEPLLIEFSRRWENHKTMTEWMRKLFFHLDKEYLDGSGAGRVLFLELLFFTTWCL
jgi:hypothetical protein